MDNVNDKTTSTRNVLIAFFILVFLVCLLVSLYMWLNRKTNGQYTVHQLVYGQDGARDRIMRGVRVLEVRLGRRLWPFGADEEEEHKNEERDVERGSEGRESEVEEEEGDEREDRGDDSSDDYSSMEGCDLRERAKLADEKEEIRECEENMEKKLESKEDGVSDEGAVGGEGSGGGVLLIDLHQLSGSAIWSEDRRSEGGLDKDHVTAL